MTTAELYQPLILAAALSVGAYVVGRALSWVDRVSTRRALEADPLVFVGQTVSRFVDDATGHCWTGPFTITKIATGRVEVRHTGTGMRMFWTGAKFMSMGKEFPPPPDKSK